MKVSLPWLKNLVDYNLTPEELASQLSLISIGVKQQTQDYLELDLTYNRGDLLSMRGVAYEVAAITDSPLRFLAQPANDFVWVNQNLSKTLIELADLELSQVQCVAKIEGLSVGPSPKEWVKRLEECGMRSVNNIVDITNLVMLEFGQPLHAFAKEAIENETIIVRRAKADEQIHTLDGKLRKLTTEDIILSDTKKALDVGGVMGGKDTEIKESTTSILLSASMFNPVMVRKTCKRLGLYSEASKRFQHGLSQMKLLQGLDAAIRMYQEIGGKLTAINFTGNFDNPRKSISLSIKKLNELLGEKLDKATVIRCLEKLNFAINPKDEDNLEILPPYFRLDINIEEDIIEEVARIYGYEKLLSTALNVENPVVIDQTLPKFIYELKNTLSGNGLTEAQTYSFYSSNVITNLGWDNYLQELVTIANPISTETQYLRVNIWPNLLEITKNNLKKGYKDIALYEIGKVYLFQEKELPKETYRLSILLLNETENPLAELKKITEKVVGELKKEIEFKHSKAQGPAQHLFHPNRFLEILHKGKPIGGLAEVHLKIANKFGIEKRVAILEIDIEKLV